MIRLLLLRHPRVVDTKLCYGLRDVDLAPGWERSAELLAGWLPEHVRVVSSPASRCRLLADRLAGLRLQDRQLAAPAMPRSIRRLWNRGPSAATGHAKVEIEPRLRELNFGRWEGQPWRELDPQALQWWREDPVNRAPPDGECLADLHIRVVSWLTEIRRLWSGTSVLCVSHTGVIRCLLAHATGKPLTEMFGFSIDFCGLTELCIDDDGSLRLDEVNQRPPGL